MPKPYSVVLHRHEAYNQKKNKERAKRVQRENGNDDKIGQKWYTH